MMFFTEEVGVGWGFFLTLCSQKESDPFQDRFKCFHNGIILIVNCFKL
jgi:hypothetical protein